MERYWKRGNRSTLTFGEKYPPPYRYEKVATEAHYHKAYSVLEPCYGVTTQAQ